MATLENVEVELTTNCQCTEEDGETASTYCYGCYEDNLTYLKDDVLPLWETRNNATDTVRIEGTGMGWTRASGWLVTETQNLVQALTLNGDYTLVFTLEGRDLRVTRYSHDEPVGARFEVTFVPDEELLA